MPRNGVAKRLKLYHCPARPVREKRISIEIPSRAAALFLLACLSLTAQEKGNWRATSASAKSITGDVTLGDEKIAINFMTFTMVRARGLEPAEIPALFSADAPAPGSGSLYRLDIPSSRRFLHHNSICGADDAVWMATYVAGRSLQLAFFSSQKAPTLTADALANSSDLCGVYGYSK
jgi:hypothetical protein